MNRKQWSKKFLAQVGAEPTKRNLLAMVSWIHAEGNGGKNNPLNTTEPWPGSTIYNDHGVRNYVTIEDGLAANSRTLNYGADRNLHGYREIRHSLRRNKRPSHTLQAVEESAWGTGGLARKVLKYVRLQWKKYSTTSIWSGQGP